MFRPLGLTSLFPLCNRSFALPILSRRFFSLPNIRSNLSAPFWLSQAATFSAASSHFCRHLIFRALIAQQAFRRPTERCRVALFFLAHHVSARRYCLCVLEG